MRKTPPVCTDGVSFSQPSNHQTAVNPLCWLQPELRQPCDGASCGGQSWELQLQPVQPWEQLRVRLWAPPARLVPLPSERQSEPAPNRKEPHPP